jgi:hypothetical protein
MKRKWALRVVLASPGDVAHERDSVERAVEQVNFLLKTADASVLLELWRYERDTHPGLNPMGPQELIESLLRIEESDVLIAVFWRRFGTPVNGAGSGTQSEIERAIESWKSRAAPEIMLFFRKPGSGAAPQAPDEQFEALQAFKRHLLATVKPFVNEFDGTVDDFQSLVVEKLWIFVQKLIPKLADPDLRPITFTLLPVRPARIRSEGHTELLANLYLQCRYEAAVVPAEPLWFSVIVFFSAPVTSRIHRGYAPYAGPRLLEIGRTTATEVHATGVSGNIVVFGPIWLTDITPHEVRTFQISNIRCSALGIGEDDLSASVMINGASVQNGSQVVAKGATGLRFQLRDPAGVSEFSGFTIHEFTGLQLSRIATLRFTEGFIGAFKSKLPVLGDTVVSGIVINTYESYAYGPIIEVADTGTCLRALFRNPLSSLRLFVSASGISNNSGLEARILEDASTLKATEITEIEGVAVRELDCGGNTSAEVVWEVAHPSSIGFTAESFIDFWVFGRCAPHAGQTSSSRAVIVNGSLAPCPAGPAHNPNGRIPRFFDTSSAKRLLIVEP